jgi:hypothetical protein
MIRFVVQLLCLYDHFLVCWITLYSVDVLQFGSLIDWGMKKYLFVVIINTFSLSVSVVCSLYFQAEFKLNGLYHRIWLRCCKKLQHTCCSFFNGLDYYSLSHKKLEIKFGP